jgi:hypothetical protein
MGVVRTFQHVRLFREMTVIENLLVAQHQQLKTGLFSGLLKTRPSAARRRSAGSRRHLARPYWPAAARQPSGEQPGLRRPASSGDCPLHGDPAGNPDAR